jgi:hypothetical protein
MSDTPRTDEQIEFVEVVGNYGMGTEYQIAYVPVDFARELERELCALRASLERAQHERDIWRARALDEVEP